MIRKEILIIGSTSFIGFNLALYLKAKGYSVNGITSSRNKKSIKKKRLKLLKIKGIKILKKNLLNDRSLLNLKKYQIVINAIGWTKNFNNKKFDFDRISKNYEIFYKNLINFFKLNSPELFIELGSSAEYGRSNKIFKENSKCNPITKYGALKLNNSNFLKKLSKKNNYPIIVLRIFSIFGYLDREDKLIEYIKNKKRLLINEPRLKQDFISINYLNKILLCILKKKKHKNFDIYNCSSNIGVTPSEIISLLPYEILKEKTIKFKPVNNQNLSKRKKVCIGSNKKIINNLKIKKLLITKEIKEYLLN